MNDFLSAIDECCKEISTSWMTSTELDPKPLEDIKAHIQGFALAHGSDILSLYNFAEVDGRYQFITTVPLLTMLCDYQKYHEEFAGFIKAAISPNWRIKDEEEALVYLNRGKEADENFRKNLFSSAAVKMTVPEAIEHLEVVMGLVILIEDIFDVFAYLNAQDLASKKAKEAVGMYQTSVLYVVRNLFDLYIGFVEQLLAMKTSKPWTAPRKHTTLVLI